MSGIIPKKRPVTYTYEEKRPDDEDEEDDEDYLSDEEGGKKRPQGSEDDDSDMDSDLDSEQEEEEEQGRDQVGRKSVKRPPKKRKRNLFIEEEAEVDEEDDEDELLDEYEEDDFINEAEDAQKLEPQIYREIDQRREPKDLEDAEDLTRRLQERYGRGAYAEPSAFVGDIAHVPMQFLLPSAKDPNLWLVRCKAGKEKEIAQNMMRKYLDYLETDHPLRIKSVVARDNLKGYIYVEARSQADVQHAVDRINNVYVSKITLVPLEEMVDVMTVKKKGVELKLGDWVRVKRGRYKGDLAQVTGADGSDRVEVKFIPRLDYTHKLGKGSVGGRDDGKKRRAAVRPPQKLFNEKDVPADNRDLSRSGSFWVWGSDRFDRDGFLVKEISLTGLDTEHIIPTLEEISKFTIGRDEESMNLTSLSIDRSGADGTGVGKSEQFALNDSVVVTEGDLINAMGTVKSIGKNHVVITIRNEGIGDVEIEKDKISRLFQVGNHVKVIRGKYLDETGMITQVKGQIVTVFSDATLSQFECFAKDVRTAADVSATENRNSGYSVQDLVQLGTAGGVGVVLKVERDQFRVLDQNGNVRAVKLTEITQKKDSKKAVALDVNQSTLHAGDVVEVLFGEYSNKQASILHLFRTWAFLMSKDVQENGGIFVVRTKMIRLAAGTPSASTQASSTFNRGYAGPAGAMAGGFKVPIAMPNTQLSGARRRELMGKTVYITKGPFKGYQGFVKDLNDKGARVQLNTNAKMVTVDPKDIRLKSERVIGRDTVNSDQPSAGASLSGLYGARTPAAFSGAQTPAHYEGAKTPAWDAGARTPAWDAGARTPSHLAYGSSDFRSLDSTWGANNYQSPYTSTPAATTSTPMAPGTPHAPTPSASYSISDGRGMDDGPVEREYEDDWLVKNLEVRFLSGDFENKVGYVSDISDGGKSGAVIVENTRVELSSKHIEPVAPNKKDACLFLSGDYKGKKGSLIGMDGNDAIVKLDSTGDFKIVSMNIVCKLRS